MLPNYCMWSVVVCRWDDDCPPLQKIHSQEMVSNVAAELSYINTPWNWTMIGTSAMVQWSWLLDLYTEDCKFKASSCPLVIFLELRMVNLSTLRWFVNFSLLNYNRKGNCPLLSVFRGPDGMVTLERMLHAYRVNVLDVSHWTPPPVTI